MLKKHDFTNHDEEYQLMKVKYDSVSEEYGTYIGITLEKLQKKYADLKKTNDECMAELSELRVQ